MGTRNPRYRVSFAYATSPRLDCGIEKMACGVLEPRLMDCIGVEYLLKILNPFMSEEWIGQMRELRHSGDHMHLELNSIEDNSVKLKKIVKIERN